MLEDDVKDNYYARFDHPSYHCYSAKSRSRVQGHSAYNEEYIEDNYLAMFDICTNTVSEKST